MYQRYRERFGTAGVVVGVIALVLAMVTGAYAAGGGLSGKQKKEVEKIAKKYAGKDGAAGAAGTNGTNGTNGKDGSNGAPGADGKSVAVTLIEEGEEGCEELGGAEVKQQGAANGTEVCNGAEGSPWTAGGTLPSGATETGTWVAAGSTGAAVSFALPTQTAIGASWFFIDGSSSSEDKEECDNGKGEAPSPDNPEAKPGNLCLFKVGGEAPFLLLGAAGPGVGRTGAFMAWTSEQTGSVGTFAVTAP
jgi:hypothetical protein